MRPNREPVTGEPTAYDQLLGIRRMVEQASHEATRVVKVPVVTDESAVDLEIGALDPEATEPVIYFRIEGAWLRAHPNGTIEIHNRRSMDFLPVESDDEAQGYIDLLGYAQLPESA